MEDEVAERTQLGTVPLWLKLAGPVVAELENREAARLLWVRIPLPPPQNVA
jgi:hypothetical protein